MHIYTELLDELNELELNSVKTNKGIHYVDIAAGFDIETTSTYIQEQKTAFMYIWAFSIGVDSKVYYGRTWAEFIELIDELSIRFNLDDEFRLPVYIHNLGYEFQFFRKYFEWVDVFAVDERKPIKATCKQGIEFRDSYILSGYSLANTAKNLVKYKVKKLVGDLDYDLIRTHKTPLTKKEMAYCENDVLIITAYIQEQIDLYGDVSKIPMTNTGRVRKYVRNECYYDKKSHKKSSSGKYSRYRRIMKNLTLSPPTYTQMKRAFMGGFTHSNAIHTGKVLENVSGLDFTSSYPSVMVSEKFPMSVFKEIKIDSMEQFNNCRNHFALVFDIQFINIRPKISHENYISESKCYTLKGAKLNNGRVHSAEEITTTITEIDFEIIEQCYEWEEMGISNVKYAHKGYLPKAIIKSVLDLYQKKTELKGVEGYEVEYMLSKGMLNSIYGMCVTDIVKDNSIYTDEWGVEKVNIIDEIDDYNSSKNRFLYYPWGVWITAYSRRNLWTGIIAMGEDYVYSDTDSMKVLNYDNHINYFEKFNSLIYEKMLLMCAEMGFNEQLLNPKTKQGEVKTMGLWDYEGLYPLFKTLGAKRYMVEDRGELHLTVAGLSKQNGVKYIEEKGGDRLGAFDVFNDSLYVPAERTGKMTHTYIDEGMKFKICDYKGVEATVSMESGIHLEKCDFTLSIAEKYKQFLSELGKGYIFTGVKEI